MSKKIITLFVIFLSVAIFAALAPACRVAAQNISVLPAEPDKSDTASLPTINSPREACQAYRTDPRFFVNNVFLKDTDTECLVQVGDNNIGYGKIDFYFTGSEFCVASSGDYFTRNGGGGTSCKTVKKQLKNINGGSVKLEPVTQGVAYRHDFSQELISLLDPSGGFNPAIYSFSLASGSGFPPMGLIFGFDGVLSGTPTGDKSGTFEACVRDLSGNSACRTYILGVKKGGTAAEGQAATQPEISSGLDIGSYYGDAKIIREGVSFPAGDNIGVFPGDTVKTGSDGFMQLVSDGRTVTLGPDTLGRMLGLNTFNQSITVPRDWDTDTNFKNELDNWKFWKDMFNDEKDFINETAPVYAIDCGLGDIISCPWGMLEFVHEGSEWFDEKMAKDFGKSVVVTPTAVVLPLATQFTIQVASDGATTLTVLDGAVAVMDLASKKSVIVKTNQKLTVPKTTTGLSSAELQQYLASVDPKSLDRWWEKKPAFSPGNFFKNASKNNMLIAGGIVLFWIIAVLAGRKIFGKPKK